MTRIFSLLAVLMMFAAACGDESAGSTGASDEVPRPDEADASDGSGESDESVDDSLRIVSMSPTATETLFAIGAGDLVVAVDDQSTYPQSAPTTDLSGFGASVESIAAHDPDLVVMWFDPGDVQSGLEALGIEVLFQPSAVTLPEVYDQIEQLGAATGQVAAATELVSTMQTRLDELVAETPSADSTVSYYHEIDNTYFTVTSSTLFGELYGLFGLENIADPADEDGSAFGYPQLVEEFIVDADPDLIFLADVDFGESVESVRSRPGWDTLSAVRAGGIVELDGEVAGRWGPRVVVYAETISAALSAMVPA